MNPHIQQLNPNSITYRNAIYQGGIDQKTETRKDFGIIYMAKTYEFIVCNNWHNDYLQGECLFYNDDKKYVYGTWINNLPQGFNVFRFEEALVMAEFSRGRLCKNTRMLVIFEKYNIGAILVVINEPQALDDLQLQIYTKKQVFSSEDVHDLFIHCQWPQQYFTSNQTLIKYISSKLTRQFSGYQRKYNTNPCKLRLIEGKYYRYGYDDGLAIVFDEDYNRVSVGSHCKSRLKSFGMVFDRPQQMVKPEKGKIIKIHSQNTLLKTAINNQLERPKRSDNGNNKNNFKTSLLIGVNFCNKFYKNPSKLFQFYMQNIINETSVRNLVAGSLTTKKLFEESLQFSRIDTNRANNLSTQQLFNQNDNFRNFQQQNEYQQGQRSSSSRLSKNKLIEDRLRLQAIKKQIYDSLEKKKTKIQKQIMNEEYQREIINKEIVGKSHYQTPQRTLDKSRSRKRIFQESDKNLKLLRDFTPSRSEPNLTPFKTKMKNRIFHGQAGKMSQPRQHNNNPHQIVERYKMNQKHYVEQSDQLQIQPAVLKDFNKFSSDHSSKNKETLSKSRDIKNRKQSQARQEDQQSLNDYHVTFQDNSRETGKISNVSSKKYPSSSGSNKYPSEGEKNHQYVPINPNEIKIKQRKRFNQNFISIEDEPEDEEVEMVLRKPSVKQSAIQTKNSKVQRRQIKQNEQKSPLKQAQKVTPQSKYYMQKKSQSQQFSHRISQQRSSKNLTAEKQISKRQFIKQLNNQNNFQDNQQQKFREERQHEYQRQNQRQISKTKERQSKRQTQKQTAKKSIYNENTFKQNTFSQQYENTQNLSQSKRSTFKHSNQVYLDQYQHTRSPVKQDETQSKRPTQSVFQHSQNKSILSRQDPKQRPREGGVSYMQKHKIKKSIEKEIERSPDRHRCYGKSSNQPYLQNSPNYSKDFSYHNSNRKGDFSYGRSEMQYEDSSYKITRKQISNPLRNYPTKLF